MWPEYPKALPHSIWFALLNTPTLKEWKKRECRWHIGTKKFSRAKGIAEQHSRQILEAESRFQSEQASIRLDRAARKAKAEIHQMSVAALMRVEQRAHDAVMEILAPTPEEYPASLADFDCVDGFLAKCAHGFYDHRRPQTDALIARQMRAMQWTADL